MLIARDDNQQELLTFLNHFYFLMFEQQIYVNFIYLNFETKDFDLLRPLNGTCLLIFIHFTYKGCTFFL